MSIIPASAWRTISLSIFRIFVSPGSQGCVIDHTRESLWAHAFLRTSKRFYLLQQRVLRQISHTITGRKVDRHETLFQLVMIFSKGLPEPFRLACQSYAEKKDNEISFNTCRWGERFADPTSKIDLVVLCHFIVWFTNIYKQSRSNSAYFYQILKI